MAQLKIPSLQHLARNWRPEPERVKRCLVKLVEDPPIFSYRALFSAVRDILVLGVNYDQVIEGIRRGIKQEDVRNNFLEVLPLIYEHFENVTPSYVESVSRRYYAAGRDLLIPFDPPLIYGAGGRMHFPWFSFWRSNPLDKERLSLFVTIVEEVLLQDPDLENAKFTILDFSREKATPAVPKPPRTLKVIDAINIPRVPHDRKVEMLNIFAAGYKMAQAELAVRPASRPRDRRRPEADVRDAHPDLFD